VSDEKRPDWDFPLTELQVKNLNQLIVKITHHWEMTGVDTSRNWIEFHPDKGKPFVAPHGWQRLFEFSGTHHNTLIVPNYHGERAIRRLDEIKAFEKKHARERSEYERLKAKFGG
jgi:hypothetical protein